MSSLPNDPFVCLSILKWEEKLFYVGRKDNCTHIQTTQIEVDKFKLKQS
jgi:hypothetical protein